MWCLIMASKALIHINLWMKYGPFIEKALKQSVNKNKIKKNHALQMLKKIASDNKSTQL